MRKKYAKDKILLSKDDLAVILAMQEKINGLKIALADACISLKAQENNLKALVISIEKLTNDYMEEAKKVARNKGVNIDNSDEGQWNLDLINYTLKKVV